MDDLGKNKMASTSKGDLISTKKHIVDFFKWLTDNPPDSTITTTRKEKNELLFLLLQLKKQLSNSISMLNMSPATTKQEFLCAICSNKITLEPLQDIWECLETHGHPNSCINKDVIEMALNQSHSKLFENGHSDPESSLDETSSLEELNSKEDSDLNSEISVDETGYLMDECEKVEIPENSLDIPSSDKNCYISSRQWYPIDPLKTKDDKDETHASSLNKNMLNNRSTNGVIRNNADGQIEKTISLNTTQTDLKTIQVNGSAFLFKFTSAYTKKVESLLYPKFYRKFDLDGDPILQKTGPERTVCLTCCCELRGRNSPVAIMDHTSGSRHCQKISKSSKTRSIIQNYHDTFLKLDNELQSHQTYFATDEDLDLLKCVVCLLYVRCRDVQAHILSELHKNKLIQLSSDSNIKSFFYFLKQHVESYGVKCAAPEVDNETKEKKVKPKRYFERHKMVKSVNESDPYLKKMPGRFIKHMKYLNVKGNLISCNVCSQGRKDVFTWQTICEHLVQPTHLVSTNSQAPNYTYQCDVCDKRLHDELSWMLHFENETERHKTAFESKKTDIPIEYECSTCKLVLFGDSSSVQKHRQSTPIKRKERNRAVQLSKETKEFFSSKAAIREHGKQLLKEAEATVARTDLVFKCCQAIENALISKYPDCKAYPFGSRVSGLGCDKSDLDLFVDIGYMYNGFQNQDVQNQTLIITTVLNLIKKRKEFTQISCIPTARTPIIRLKHKITNLECDISFVHGLSVENTKFLRYCFELQPILQQLILLVKKWSNLCGLSENISTYALAMLGVFYMQKHSYLPSVCDLKQLNKTNVTIVGWQTIDYVTPKVVVQDYYAMFRSDIHNLLAGFFQYYSQFNYKECIVCPLLGTEFKKEYFSVCPKGSALPPEMHSYVTKVNTESSPEYFRCLSPFCIQDPFDLSHNLTKACSNVTLNKFVRLCGLTHSMLRDFKA